MREQDISRSRNRAKINDVFNGSPPLTDEEAEQNHQDTNCNFLEGTTVAHRARSTWNNAFLKPGGYFTVSLDRGPIWKRDGYAARITSHINKPLKRSRRYTETVRATGAQVVLHGVGPSWWCRPRYWLPEEIGIEDLIVPDGTRTNLDNLTYFGIYQQFTPGQLHRLTHGPKTDPGWRMGAVNRQLRAAASSLNRRGFSDREMENPEKLAEFYKSNAGITDTARVPTIDCWSFFYQDEEDEKGRWFKKIIPDVPRDARGDDEFLYSPKRAYAGDLSQILHLHFGDGANVAPFLYHSVRSIGFLLYAICHLQNRLRSRFMDAVFEGTLQYFKNIGEGDRALVQKVELMHMGFIPEGLQLVPQAERWQVNEALIGAGLANNRQLMSENASSFVQDVDTGTAKELTATEVMARLNQANALVSSVQSMAYTYAEYQYREICRRFCLKDSPDPDVQRFRKDCLADGVPEEYLNVECWNVQPERVMGGGNKTLEIAQAKALMEIKGQFDPPQQRMVTRRYVLAVSDDADLASALVPLEKPGLNTSARDGQLAFGALMSGGDVAVRTGIDHVSYVDAILASLLSLIEDLEFLQKQGELPSGQQIHGVLNVVKHVSGHIQIVAQDKDNGERIKHYKDVLANVMNRVKGYSQRLDEKREAEQQDQVEIAKVKALVMEAQARTQIMVQDAKLRAQITQGEAAQSLKIEQAEFLAEQQRANLEAQTDAENTRRRTAADIEALDAKTAADIEATAAKTAAAVEAKRATAKAAAAAAKAKPKPKAK